MKLLLAPILLAIAASSLEPDPLWLRYSTEVPNLDDYANISGIAVVATALVCQDPAALPALQAAADELSSALTGLLGRSFPSTCCGCDHAEKSTGVGGLLVSVGGSVDLGPEGFTITGLSSIAANTPSGALYGAYRFISYVQRHAPLPASLTWRRAFDV